MERVALRVSGMIFAVVALTHLSRLILKWGFVVAGWTVPMWMSAVGLVVTTGLAIWTWALSFRDRGLRPPWER